MKLAQQCSLILQIGRVEPFGEPAAAGLRGREALRSGPTYLVSMWTRLTGTLALVAHDRCGRIKALEAAETEATQDAADGRERQAPPLRGDIALAVTASEHPLDTGCIPFRPGNANCYRAHAHSAAAWRDVERTGPPQVYRAAKRLSGAASFRQRQLMLDQRIRVRRLTLDGECQIWALCSQSA